MSNSGHRTKGLNNINAVKKAKEVFQYYHKFGKENTLATFNIQESTLDRYLRAARKEGEVPNTKSAILNKIASNYTDIELQAIANGGRLVPGMKPVPIIDFDGEHIRIGVITDTHMGHMKYSPNRLIQAFDEFHKEKVDFVVHVGDIVEGMNNNHEGQIYELTHLGYERQKAYAVQQLGQWTDTEIYGISGNHDRWYLKSNGANIAGDIDKELKNFHFLGHDEGDISLKGKAILKLWHGEDGSSYALSYRLQKLIESLSGGEKPAAMFCGHTHKYVKIFERNVWCVSAGSIEAQTQWMRSKKLAAHVGFVIVDLWVNDTGICKMGDTWYPFFT